MGRLWDFDNIMNADDTWGDAHNRYIFRSLWNIPNDAFTTQYVSLWLSINNEVYQGLTDFFNSILSSELCQALEQSIELNNKRWNTSNRLATENIELAHEYFSKRWLWLNQSIVQLTDGINSVEQIPDAHRQLQDSTGGSINPIFDLQGRQIYSSLEKGIYIQNGRKVVVR